MISVNRTTDRRSGNIPISPPTDLGGGRLRGESFFRVARSHPDGEKVLNLKLRDLLEKKKDELARLMTLEMASR